jgi:tripartite-type tricarboxylate transporter receptor subunit TctC
MRRRHLLQAGALSACSAFEPAARADSYPSKPVQIVVPFPPGGTNDLLARVLTQSLGEQMHGSFVIDNRAGGAAGSVGAQAVAAAKPDGYTLLLGNTASLAINQSVYLNLRYDPQRDFEPISVVGGSSLVLAVNSKVPARNVAEFVQLLRSSPGQYSYASAGAGSPLHLAGELFKFRTGTEMLHVPYRGTAPAYTDLLSGTHLRNVRQHHDRGAARPGRHDPGAGGDGRTAQRAVPSGADARGRGVQGHRSPRMVRAGSAEVHRPDDHQSACTSRRDDRERGRNPPSAC